VDDTPKSAPQPSSPASTPFSRPAAYALLAALVVIWGLNWPIMKLVVHAMPAWGLAASTLWLGEALPASLVLGGILILLGVAAIAVGDTRHH